MKNQIWQIFVVILATATVTFFITKGTLKPEKGLDIVKVDTLKIKADTVYRPKYIKAKLQAQIDTVTINDTVRQLIARADTLIRKDSSYIKVSYHFPPENFFDIDMNIKEKLVTITRELVTPVPADVPWWDHFIVGAGSVLAVLVSVLLLIK